MRRYHLLTFLLVHFIYLFTAFYPSYVIVWEVIFFPQFPLQLFFFFYSTFRVWKMKAFWVRNDQGQTPEAKEYIDTVQSATDPTQTTMSAKISNNQQGKKLSNGAKEGWGGWGQREKDNTFTNSDHWEKLKQIFVVQFQRLFANMKRKCIVLLNGWGNKRTKAKKKKSQESKKFPLQNH